MPIDYKKPQKARKPKVIKKDLLMQVRLAYIKYYNCNDDTVCESLWKEWRDACNKAFPINRNTAWRKFELLKKLSRDLAHEPFETWCKVYSALGYIVE